MSKRRGKEEGSIYQRASDGKWCASVDLGWQDGTRRRKVVYGRTRKDVADKLKKLHTDQEQGISLAPDEWTVATFLRYWLEHIIKIRGKPYHSRARQNKTTPTHRSSSAGDA